MEQYHFCNQIPIVVVGFLGLQPHYHGCSSQCFGFYQWVHLHDHELCLGVLPPKLAAHFLEIRTHQDSGTSMSTMRFNAKIFGYTSKFTFKSLVKQHNKILEINRGRTPSILFHHQRFNRTSYNKGNSFKIADPLDMTEGD